MDKNLNSPPKVPWWIILIQMSPLILQLINEVVNRSYGSPLGNPSQSDKAFEIPDPVGATPNKHPAS